MWYDKRYVFEKVLDKKHYILKIGGTEIVAYAEKLKEDFESGKDVNIDDMFFEGTYNAWVSANDK